MKAVILAGGFATRLRPLSCTRPKILFPIVNKPLLQWTFERLAKYGIDDAILAVNHQTEAAIKQYQIPKCGLKVRFSLDPPRKPLGSGGPIKKAEQLLGGKSPFLALNGDIFADVDYREILKRHNEEKAIATIALTEVDDPTRYGVAELAKDGRIKRFKEKPSKEDAPSNLINAGVYVLSPKIFDYIAPARKVSIEYEVFPKLVKERKLYGHVFKGLWMDIGKPEDYFKINRILLKSVSSRRMTKALSHVKIKNPVAVDKAIRVGKDSTIGPYVVLGRDVIIGNHVYIQNSIVLHEATICDYSSVTGAIIGDSVFIGKGAKIEEGCILGDHARIADNVTLAKEVSVCPAKEISENVLTPGNIC